MRRRAILIGNGSFPPESELASLAGPAADIHRLAQVLSDPAAGGFETDELIDQASFELLPRIEQRFHEADPDDLLLVHYSGHGKLNRLGQLFLACRNTVAATLQTTSVPVELLRELVRGCDARSVVLVLDCCFSGAAARAFLRSNVEDRLQALNGEGIYLLTSVDAIHSAEESDDSDGETMGLFTRHLVAGLESGDADVDRDGKITINDLQLYLNRSIRRQSPRFWTFDAGQDVVLCHRGKPREVALHPGLQAALANPFASVRFAALEDVERLLTSGDEALRPAVVRALERAVNDDSRKVSRRARAIFGELEPSVTVPVEAQADMDPDPAPAKNEQLLVLPDVDPPQAPGALLQVNPDAAAEPRSASGSSAENHPPNLVLPAAGYVSPAPLTDPPHIVQEPEVVSRAALAQEPFTGVIPPSWKGYDSAGSWASVDPTPAATTQQLASPVPEKPKEVHLSFLALIGWVTLILGVWYLFSYMGLL
jgi:hypothetical protein